MPRIPRKRRSPLSPPVRKNGWNDRRALLTVVGILLSLFAAELMLAQGRGSLSGVVVATRTDDEGDRALLAEVESESGKSVDRVEIELSRACADNVEAALMPTGWTLHREGRRATLQGPAREGLFRLRLELGSCPPPAQTRVSLGSEGRTLGRGKVPVESWPPVTTIQEPREILSLPPAAASGDEISFQVLDEVKTPRGGRWNLGGRVLSEPEETEARTARENLVTNGYSLGGSLPEPLGPGEAITLSYVDPWGDKIVDVDLSEHIAIVPRTEMLNDEPKITDCTPRTFVGDEFCVCGRFPEQRYRESIAIDGVPLGPPLAASSVVATFRSSESVAPGEHVISGDPEAGFSPADTAKLVVLQIHGHLDREQLWLGAGGTGSTQMSLRVEGTDQPVTFELVNHTPSIISLEGGESQRATTSGGLENSLYRRVTGLEEGDFNLTYELAGSGCPCSGPGTEEAIEDQPPAVDDEELDVTISDDEASEDDLTWLKWHATADAWEGDKEFWWLLPVAPPGVLWAADDHPASFYFEVEFKCSRSGKLVGLLEDKRTMPIDGEPVAIEMRTQPISCGGGEEGFEVSFGGVASLESGIDPAIAAAVGTGLGAFLGAEAGPPGVLAGGAVGGALGGAAASLSKVSDWVGFGVKRWKVCCCSGWIDRQDGTQWRSSSSKNTRSALWGTDTEMYVNGVILERECFRAANEWEVFEREADPDKGAMGRPLLEEEE